MTKLERRAVQLLTDHPRILDGKVGLGILHALLRGRLFKPDAFGFSKAEGDVSLAEVVRQVEGMTWESIDEQYVAWAGFEALTREQEARAAGLAAAPWRSVA